MSKVNVRYIVSDVDKAIPFYTDMLGFNDRFHGTDPPNFNEGTHLISGKGPTPFQVVPFVF